MCRSTGVIHIQVKVHTEGDCVYLYLNHKKGSRTHPIPLGIVRRRPPQFYNILCSIDGEPPHLLMAPGLSTSPIYYITFSLMFISSMARNHKVNGDLSANNNMAIKMFRQLYISPTTSFSTPFCTFWDRKTCQANIFSTNSL